MVLIIVGVVLLALGALLLFLRKRTLDKLLEVRSMQNTPVAEILDTHRSVAAELGGGAFRLMVETAGTVACDAPLTAELSGTPCAHYSYSVEERYEESYWERDAEGRDVQRTRQSSRTVASGERTARFHVVDGESRLLIDPEGAHLDLETTVDQFQPAGGGLALGFGDFTFSAAAPIGDRVLGYHYRESILPVDAPLYVIGEASDAATELAVVKPGERAKPFIVSIRSKEQVVRTQQGKGTALLIGAIVSFAAGLGMIVGGVMKMKGRG